MQPQHDLLSMKREQHSVQIRRGIRNSIFSGNRHSPHLLTHHVSLDRPSVQEQVDILKANTPFQTLIDCHVPAPISDIGTLLSELSGQNVYTALLDLMPHLTVANLPSLSALATWLLQHLSSAPVYLQLLICRCLTTLSSLSPALLECPDLPTSLHSSLLRCFLPDTQEEIVYLLGNLVLDSPSFKLSLVSLQSLSALQQLSLQHQAYLSQQPRHLQLYRQCLWAITNVLRAEPVTGCPVYLDSLSHLFSQLRPPCSLSLEGEDEIVQALWAVTAAGGQVEASVMQMALERIDSQVTSIVRGCLQCSLCWLQRGQSLDIQAKLPAVLGHHTRRLRVLALQILAQLVHNSGWSGLCTATLDALVAIPDKDISFQLLYSMLQETNPALLSQMLQRGVFASWLIRLPEDKRVTEILCLLLERGGMEGSMKCALQQERQWEELIQMSYRNSVQAQSILGHYEKFIY